MNINVYVQLRVGIICDIKKKRTKLDNTNRNHISNVWMI